MVKGPAALEVIGKYDIGIERGSELRFGFVGNLLS